MDRLTGMEVFVRAIRLGGLSAAGRDLRMSATMAAKHVDALEARIGSPLVHRTTRRLTLTEAGADFFEKAERILLEIRDAEADAAAQAVEISGLLRVSAPATFGVVHIAPLVPAFTALYPDVQLEFGFNDRQVDLLEERWDMAIRIGRLADSSLISRKLLTLRMAVAAAPAYLKKRGAPKRLSDLAQHDCLCRTRLTSTEATTWSFGYDGSIKVLVSGPMQADNGEGLLRAAEAGLGIYYGPRFIAARALQAGTMVELDLESPLSELGSAYALTHPARRPAAKTRAWIEFLMKTLPLSGRNW